MTVDDAVAQAKMELTRLFPDTGRDLRLEEAETPLSNGKTWRLTFSMSLPEPQGDSLADILRPRRMRRIVELTSESGELLSIKAA